LSQALNYSTSYPLLCKRELFSHNELIHKEDVDMKVLHTLWRLLGNVYTALFLIAFAAIYVAIGTVLEAKSGSHRMAAHYIFSSHVFAVLLCGFFVNIAIAAIQRWPWRTSHLAFLSAHLGLLLLLSGAIIKIYYGVQGSLALVEGGGTDEFFIADTYAVKVDRRIPGTYGWRQESAYFTFDPADWQGTPLALTCQNAGWEDVSIQMTAWHPHSAERLDSWIKNHTLALQGMPSIAVITADALPNHKPHLLPIQGPYGPEWQVYSIQHPTPASVIADIFKQHTTVDITSDDGNIRINDLSLLDLAEGKFIPSLGKLSAKVTAEPSTDTTPWHIKLQILCENERGQTSSSTKLTLQQPPRLPLTLDTSSACTLKIHSKPTLVCVVDEEEDHLTWLAFDDQGLLYSITTPQYDPQDIYAHDIGFKGYTTNLRFPFPLQPYTLADRQQALWYSFYLQLKNETGNTESLITPLAILYQTCHKYNVDPAATLTIFLKAWHDASTPLCNSGTAPGSIIATLQNLDWSSLPINNTNKCDPALLLSAALAHYNLTPTAILQNFALDNWPDAVLKWHAANLFKHRLLLQLPSAAYLTSEETAKLVSTFPEQSPVKQAIDAAYRTWRSAVPELPENCCYAIENYLPPLASPLEDQTELALEDKLSAAEKEQVLTAEVTASQRLLPSLTKWEDNLPFLRCHITTSDGEQDIAMAYDRYGTGLTWPIHNGYRVRFQPLFQKLPYRLRLRQARQINYPQSSQPLGYESDLWITEAGGSEAQLVRLSMNEVWESWDGYRFYLANIAPGTPGALQHVQLAVNRDPVKYWLTYPGGIFLALGIILLLRKLQK
jgi:hypothetical protein